jgi:hypothetical protein
MKLERLVQIHVGLMATVGAMLLGLARGTFCCRCWYCLQRRLL